MNTLMKAAAALKKLRAGNPIVQPTPQSPPQPSPATIRAMKALTQLKAAKEPVDENPPFECEICHKAIANRNDVVCFANVGGDDSKSPPYLALGVPKRGWSKLVCSTKCAHALLDVQIVTWRLRGLFNVPEEEDEY
jgi:hypothetical protein